MNLDRLSELFALCSETARLGDKTLSARTTVGMVTMGEIDIWPPQTTTELTDMLDDRLGQVKANLRQIRDILNTIDLGNA